MLLPSDAHLRCKGRVFVLVTALGSGMTPSSSPLSSFGSSSSEGQGTSFAVWPPLRRVRVTDFVDRKDLLDALLASVCRPNLVVIFLLSVASDTCIFCLD